ncbi:hypothetical protein [Mesorhizobium sp. CN2-181]|uniref:hypothetical protein n=1 Tax=Mesorhizobium yinganensis TaxID=3157707 RepID=UPI0032B820CC
MRMEEHLSQRATNHVSLTPVEFLKRAVEVFPERPKVAWNEKVWTYAQFGRIVGRFARFLVDSNETGRRNLCDGL